MIKIQNLKKIYNGNTVLDIDNLGVAKGELIGLVGNNGAGKTTLLRLILDLMLAGETTGERLWQLPLWNEYDQMLQGQFGDIKNIGDGTAGTIAGGAFLRQFVPEGIPWAHLDIAGTAWHEAATAAHAPGATLVPARLLVEWAAQFRPER